MSNEKQKPVMHDRPLTRPEAAKEYAREKAADHNGTLTPEQQVNREKNMLLASKVALKKYMAKAKKKNYMPHVDLNSETTKWFTQLAEMNLADTLYTEGGIKDVKKFAKSMHEDVAHDMERDELTGVLKRKELNAALDAENYDPKAIVFIDALDFGKVNKKYTHDTGDKVLQMIVEAISKQARDNDLVARWGGDEFAVVVRESREEAEKSSSHKLSEEALANIVERIQKSLEDIIETAQLNDRTGASSKPGFKGHSLRITGTHEDGSKEEFIVDPKDIGVSVGGALWDDEQSLQQNLSRAEKFMKKDKKTQHEALNNHQ